MITTSTDPAIRVGRIAQAAADVIRAELPAGSRVVLVVETDHQHPGLNHASSELAIAIGDLAPATASRVLRRALSRVEAEGRSA